MVTTADTSIEYCIEQLAVTGAPNMLLLPAAAGVLLVAGALLLLRSTRKRKALPVLLAIPVLVIAMGWGSGAAPAQAATGAQECVTAEAPAPGNPAPEHPGPGTPPEPPAEIVCPEGQEAVDGACACPEDQELIDGACVAVPQECEPGQQWNGSECVPIVCGGNEVLNENNQCVCAWSWEEGEDEGPPVFAGYVRIGGVCRPARAFCDDLTQLYFNDPPGEFLCQDPNPVP